MIQEPGGRKAHGTKTDWRDTNSYRGETWRERETRQAGENTHGQT